MSEHISGSAASRLVRRRRDRAVGIYIHVPFCARRCPYCDFAVDVRQKIPHRAYAEALIAEFEARKSALLGRRVQTIYLGGGTPSLWEPGELARVLGHIRGFLSPERAPGVAQDAVAEICMEANPNNITTENLGAWAAAGVGRLSIGCQSFQPRVLKVLNRNHTAAQARQAVERAIDFGAFAVSLDLIFGNPEQTMAEWRQDLDEAEEIEGLAHLSAYNLTVEAGTAFYRRRARGRLALPTEERSAEMLDYLIERAEGMGFERYEVSNFSRPGHRSRHNTLYWTGAEYLGLGVGAHSLRIEDEPGAENPGVYRPSNPRLVADYMAAPGAPADAESGAPLSAQEHLIERLFLGVRTRAGLCFGEVSYQFSRALPAEVLRQAEALLEEMSRGGFLERDGERFIPTHRGLNVADALAEQFARRLSS